MTAILSWFLGSSMGRGVGIMLLVVAAVALGALTLRSTRKAGEAVGRMAEALETATTGREAIERMSDAAVNRPTSDDAALRWLRGAD